MYQQQQQQQQQQKKKKKKKGYVQVRVPKWVHCLFLCLFLFSLDNFLLINVITSFFGNQILEWRSFEKGALLTYFSLF